MTTRKATMTKTKAAPAKGVSRSAAGGAKASARESGRAGPVWPGREESLSVRLRFVRSAVNGRKRDCVDVLGGMLLESLDPSPQKEVAAACIEALTKTDQAKAFEVLSDALNRPAAVDVLPKALRVLGTVHQKDVLRPLEAIALNDGHPFPLRRQAIQSLVRRGSTDSWTSVARVLLRATERKDRSLATELIETLRRMTNQAYPVYVKVLRATSDEERMCAAHALGMMGDRKAIDPLRSAANNTKDRVLREVATKAALMLYLA